MASELRPIDLKCAPPLSELVEDVRKTNRPRIIRADGEDVAVLMPAPKGRNPRQGKAFTKDDGLWSVVGIGESTTPTDIAMEKDAYLAEAYRAKTT